MTTRITARFAIGGHSAVDFPYDGELEQIFGLYPQKGALRPGSDADLVIVNPEKRWTLAAEHLFSRHKHSPFIGREFHGAVDLTFVRGRAVYEHGRIVAAPGHRQLLARAV